MTRPPLKKTLVSSAHRGLGPMTLWERRLLRRLGGYLREERQMQELPLAVLARVSKISEEKLSRAERGQVNIRIGELVRWTRALKCSVRDLASEIPALNLYL